MFWLNLCQLEEEEEKELTFPVLVVVLAMLEGFLEGFPLVLELAPAPRLSSPFAQSF